MPNKEVFEGNPPKPTEDAGIQIERGAEANTLLIWNETVNAWQFTNDGTTYYDMITGGSGGSAIFGKSDYKVVIDQMRSALA